MVFFLWHGLHDFHHDGALDALAEEFTAGLIDAADGTAGVIGVGGAAAGTVKSCPAVATFFPGIGIALPEGFPERGVGHTVPDIAHEIFFISDELMAGIEIAPGRDSHVLRS